MGGLQSGSSSVIQVHAHCGAPGSLLQAVLPPGPGRQSSQLSVLEEVRGASGTPVTEGVNLRERDVTASHSSLAGASLQSPAITRGQSSILLVHRRGGRPATCKQH